MGPGFVEGSSSGLLSAELELLKMLVRKSEKVVCRLLREDSSPEATVDSGAG